MRKILSLLVALSLVLSLCPIVSATTTHDNGTQVTYVGQGTEEYSVTVPALLNPGQTGNVTLNGTWPSNRVVTVTSQKTVELTNNLNQSDKKILDITFSGISESGDNTKAQTFTRPVSVSDISAAMFGTWTGKFYYTVDILTRASVGVSATGSNGEDLNAKSYEIIGQTKDELLNKLEESDLIDSAADVDALIEVESDEFDNMANTTFDVSSIAEPGDRIVILHFDNTTKQWEFIAEREVQSNSTVTADFSSYSPVAFVVIKDDGSMEIVEPEMEPGILLGISPYDPPKFISWAELIDEGYAVTETAINEYAFNDQVIIEIVIPDTVTTIGDYAFSGCDQLQKVVIGNSVESIRNCAFESCENLTSITIPDSVKSLEFGVFSHCTNLKTASIGAGLTSLTASTFEYCSSLSEITIPGTVNDISFEAFVGCAELKTVILSEGTTRIGDSAFAGCSAIESITIPSSIEYIGWDAFSGCSSLQNITFAGTIDQWSYIEIYDSWNTYVPATKVVCVDGEIGLEKYCPNCGGPCTDKCPFCDELCSVKCEHMCNGCYFVRGLLCEQCGTCVYCECEHACLSCGTFHVSAESPIVKCNICDACVESEIHNCSYCDKDPHTCEHWCEVDMRYHDFEFTVCDRCLLCNQCVCRPCPICGTLIPGWDMCYPNYIHCTNCCDCE